MNEDRAVREMSSVEGWLSEDEARLLYRSARDASVGKPGRIVEIGSYKGRSTVVLGLVASDHCLPETVVSIDPHHGVLTGLKVEPTWETFKDNLQRRALLGTYVVPIRKASLDVDWTDQISFLFLDGLHDSRSVGMDYMKYSPFVPVGGLIAFHDYSNRDYPGVRRVVNSKIDMGELEIYAMAPADRRENTLIVTRKCPLLSIIIPTCGRQSLETALESIIDAGVEDCDEVFVVGDGRQEASERQVHHFIEEWEPRFHVAYLEHGPTKMVGAAQRQFAMTKATGTHLAFLDDDDTYLPDALDTVRKEILVAPDRVLLFKEESKTDRHPWGIVWKDKELRCGNVGTQGVVVPNVPGRLGVWGHRNEGDYDFIRSTVDLYPNKDKDIVWVDRVIAQLH